jgi:Tfp pilus assembly protein PilF
MCARKRDDPAQAETWLRKALELNPDNSSALLNMAELSQKQDNTLACPGVPAALSRQEPPHAAEPVAGRC